MAKSGTKAGKPKSPGTGKNPGKSGGEKLRGVGRKAAKLTGQPIVNEIVAAAMLGAAAALREGGTRRAAAAGGKKGSGAAGDIARETNKLGDTLRALAIDVARKTIDAWEEKGAAAPKGGGSRRGGKA